MKSSIRLPVSSFGTATIISCGCCFAIKLCLEGNSIGQ
jgi:hypothetical protein